jgi:RNA polymerase sigma-B factor
VAPFPFPSKDETVPQTTAPTATGTAETLTAATAPATAPARHHDIDTDVEQLATAAATADPDTAADLRERMVLTALPLADAIALRYAGRGIETDDLLQVARTALVKAVHRYHPGTGPGFAAFAAPTISGEVKRWFRDHGWSVRPPRRLQELRAALAGEEERLRHALARDPHDTEIAAVLTVTPADVAEARACSAGYHATSLDAPTPAGTPLADHLLTTENPTTTIDLHDALRQAITQLTDRERTVLRLRFVDELTQSQIGDHIGVSQMQVSRILRTTLTRLRTHLADTDTPHTHNPAA